MRIFSCFIFLFVILVGFWAYGVNGAVADTLFIENAAVLWKETQQDIRALEADIARVSMGSGLEERARALGLRAGGPLRFIAKEELVVHRNP